MDKLESSLRKFHVHHHDLVNRYGITVTNNHAYVLCVLFINHILFSLITYYRSCKQEPHDCCH